MNIVDNWFNNYEVAEIFAKERNCKLISKGPILVRHFFVQFSSRNIIIPPSRD